MSELARQGRDSAPAPLPLREQVTAPAPLETDAPAAKSEPPDAPAVRAGVMLRQVREAAGINADLLNGFFGEIQMRTSAVIPLQTGITADCRFL